MGVGMGGGQTAGGRNPPPPGGRPLSWASGGSFGPRGRGPGQKCLNIGKARTLFRAGHLEIISWRSGPGEGRALRKQKLQNSE